MKRLDQLKMSTIERRWRWFSDNFKIQKVREIETGQTKVSEICSQYQVAEKMSIFGLTNLVAFEQLQSEVDRSELLYKTEKHYSKLQRMSKTVWKWISLYF